MNNEQKISFLNYEVVIGEVPAGSSIKYVARGSRMTPKAKYAGSKVVFNYSFGSAEKRNEFVSKFRADREAILADKEAAKQKVRDIRANFSNPFKVGEIFYDSWGYDQTNIDFYQIVEVKAKSVVIRKIAQQYVSGAAGWAEYVKPDPGQFIGGPETKIIQIDSGGRMHINGYRGWISPYDAGERGLYQSHYA